MQEKLKENRLCKRETKKSRTTHEGLAWPQTHTRLKYRGAEATLVGPLDSDEPAQRDPRPMSLTAQSISTMLHLILTKIRGSQVSVTVL